MRLCILFLNWEVLGVFNVMPSNFRVLGIFLVAAMYSCASSSPPSSWARSSSDERAESSPSRVDLYTPGFAAKIRYPLLRVMTMAPNRIVTTICRQRLSAVVQLVSVGAVHTNGSAQPGNFHAGLLFHRGSSGVVEFLAKRSMASYSLESTI